MNAVLKARTREMREQYPWAQQRLEMRPPCAPGRYTDQGSK